MRLVSEESRTQTGARGQVIYGVAVNPSGLMLVALFGGLEYLESLLDLGLERAGRLE